MSSTIIPDTHVKSQLAVLRDAMSKLEPIEAAALPEDDGQVNEVEYRWPSEAERRIDDEDVADEDVGEVSEEELVEFLQCQEALQVREASDNLTDYMPCQECPKLSQTEPVKPPLPDWVEPELQELCQVNKTAMQAEPVQPALPEWVEPDMLEVPTAYEYTKVCCAATGEESGPLSFDSEKESDAEDDFVVSCVPELQVLAPPVCTMESSPPEPCVKMSPRELAVVEADAGEDDLDFLASLAASSPASPASAATEPPHRELELELAAEAACSWEEEDEAASPDPASGISASKGAEVDVEEDQDLVDVPLSRVDTEAESSTLPIPAESPLGVPLALPFQEDIALPVELIQVRQPGPSRVVTLAVSSCARPHSAPALEAPPAPTWTDSFDFTVPDEVQPPMPLPQRKGCRSVTGGRVIAASRLDNKRPSTGSLPGGFVDRGSGPLQVRATCSLTLPTRSPLAAEEPTSGDNTDVPRSSRSSMSEGGSSSSGSRRSSQDRLSPASEAEYEGLARWLRSEDFFTMSTPRSASRVKDSPCEDVPPWLKAPSPVRRLKEAQPEEPDDWDKKVRKGLSPDPSAVAALPSSPALGGRGGGGVGRDAFLPLPISSEVQIPQRRDWRNHHDRFQQRRSVWCAFVPRPESCNTRPGLKAEAAEASPEAPSACNFLRQQFADIDFNNHRLVSRDNLVEFICGRLSRDSNSEALEELENLMRESARRCFRQAIMQPRGLHVEDWVHYGLMLASAPSQLAHDLLNRRLRRELEWRPTLLRQLIEAFEAADVRGIGSLRPSDVLYTFETGDRMLKVLGIESEDHISYYDFVAYCLGLRKTPVVLNWYDVSYGYAQWFPSKVLGGQKLDGIWHTGVVAFGREYWYGGKVFSSDPGHAPFPPGPLRSTHLGYTHRTREELEDFLRFEMVPRYTRENYDVMRHNCNHFSEEVSSFLVQGSHIPEEALMQPESLMSPNLFEKFRPYVNTWLSGFEATGGDAGIDDLIAEWRARLWPGDLALYVPHGDHHEPARLVQVSNVDNWAGTCDVAYFESQEHNVPSNCTTRDARALRWDSCAHSESFWDWKVVRRQAVQICLLRPHTVCGRGHSGTAGSGLCGNVRAQLKNTNPDVQVHLRRKGMVYAHCPQGHFMACCSRRRSWSWTRAPSCGICGKSVAFGEGLLECAACSFYICGPCDHKGLFRGYYSLGSIDAGMAKLLIEEMQWVRYKAKRYMSAAGAVGMLELDAWLKRVAPRLYGDLGLDVPTTVELIQAYRRYNRGQDGSPARFAGLAEEEFCDLLFELLALLAVGSAGVVSL